MKNKFLILCFVTGVAFGNDQRTKSGKILTEKEHRNVAQQIVEHVSNAPNFLEAARRVLPLVSTNPSLMESSIEALANFIARLARKNNQDVSVYATRLLYVLTNSKKPIDKPLAFIATKALAKAGVDVNSSFVSKEGDLFSQELTLFPLKIAAQKGNTGMLEALIQEGANVNQEDSEGYTPLVLAAREGYPEIVDLLVKAGANVNVAYKGGYTPLMFAAQKGNKETVDLLIQAGANVNGTTNAGATALMLAAPPGHIKVVKALLAAGAKKDLKDRMGETVFMKAIGDNMRGFIKGYHLFQLLNEVERDPSLSKIKEFIVQMDKEEEKVIDEKRNTLLHRAVEIGNPKLAQLILIRRPGLIAEKNKDGFTPVELAIAKNQWKILEIFMKASTPI